MKLQLRTPASAHEAEHLRCGAHGAGLLLAGVLMMICSSCSIPAQNEGNVADFSGTWERLGGVDEPWPKDPPYTPDGRAAQLAFEANPESDPALRCEWNLMRMVAVSVIEIIPQDKVPEKNRITILYEYGPSIRRIWMDGREHPDWVRGLLGLVGHSIGHWEGSTLVVETVGIRPGYLRVWGLPHTSDLRVVERYTLKHENGAHKLEAHFTFYEPKYYTMPWSVTLEYERSDHEFMEYFCVGDEGQVVDPTYFE